MIQGKPLAMAELARIPATLFLWDCPFHQDPGQVENIKKEGDK